MAGLGPAGGLGGGGAAGGFAGGPGAGEGAPWGAGAAAAGGGGGAAGGGRERERAAYLAGERAALARAFAEALPGNRRLGALEERVAALGARVGDAEARGEAAVGAIGELRGRLEAAGGRGADAAEGVAEALRDLCEVQRARGSSARRGALARAAAFLFGHLRRADVAVLFLSRTILFDAQQGRVSPEAVAARNAMAAGLLLGIAELSWRAHRRFLRASPKTMAHVARPFTQGLSLARTALWGSAFIIGAHHVKGLCYTVANEFFASGGGGGGARGRAPATPGTIRPRRPRPPARDRPGWRARRWRATAAGLQTATATGAIRAPAPPLRPAPGCRASSTRASRRSPPRSGRRLDRTLHGPWCATGGEPRGLYLF